MLLFFTALFVATLYARPAEIIPALAAMPIAQIVAIACAVCAAASYLAAPRPLFSRRADRFLIGFWVAIALSNAAWGWWTGAAEGASTFFTVVFTYFLIRLAATTPRRIHTLVWVLVAMCVFQAVNGIVQYHTGVGFGDVTTVQDGRIRGTGIFNDPNDLGMALVMVVPFLLSPLIGGSVGKRALAAAALGPILLAIYYTNSRGAVLGVTAALTVYFWSRFRNALAPLVVVVLLIGVVAAAPARAGEMNADEQSAQGRIQAWSAGLVMFRSHPLTGVGYGRFTEFHVACRPQFIRPHVRRTRDHRGVLYRRDVGLVFPRTPPRAHGDIASRSGGQRRRDAGLRHVLIAAIRGRPVRAARPWIRIRLDGSACSRWRSRGGPGIGGSHFVLSLAGIVLTRVLVLLLAHS